jgi:hypothetical protein
MSWEREIIIYIVTLVLMLWPLAINRAPFYASDSASYLRGGALGFNTGLTILGLSKTAPANDPKTIVAGAISKSGGARSAIYSVAVFLLRAPGNTLLALTIVQTALAALMLSFLRRAIAPDIGVRGGVAAGAAVATLTSAAWYAGYAMPDILAGIIVCASLLLTVFFDRFGTIVHVALVLLIAFCITAHGSHLPIAVVTLIAGGVANSRLRSVSAASRHRIAWFASPVIVAVIAMLVTSYVAFGQFSLAPKRYPIQLARSVADGPGAWYLHDHCAIEHYAICEVFGPDPPRNVHEFLWGDNGVRNRATPEQMDRIRAEEGAIVRQATMAYLAVQIRQSTTNAILQFFRFGPRDLVFGVRMVGSGPDISLVQIDPDRPVLKAISKLLIYASFVGSILLLVIIRRRLTSREIAALTVVTAGLLANAVVCGALSGVTDRYQGRVAWVLPAVAVMILLRVWGRGENAATTAKVALA